MKYVSYVCTLNNTAIITKSKQLIMSQKLGVRIFAFILAVIIIFVAITKTFNYSPALSCFIVIATILSAIIFPFDKYFKK